MAQFLDFGFRRGTGPGHRLPHTHIAFGMESRIRGVSLSAPRRAMKAGGLDPIDRVAANWVAVIPYAFVDPGDSRVVFDREHQFWGETTGGVAKTIQFARQSGLSVLLKPHLWVRGQGWPGRFEPGSAEDWDVFLDSYRAYILRFARLADSLDVKMMSVGTEIDRIALSRPEYWRSLIAEVRSVYRGQLTYAANWDAYAQIDFWDELDLVGVDAYFPLVDDATPSVEELVDVWEPWIAELRDVARATGKAILFTEYGYRSVDGAAGKQWELPQERWAHGPPENDETQAAAYEALFRVLWERLWFAGGFLWKWYAGSPDGDWLATDYSPQGKAAETVIASWYGGDVTPRLPSVFSAGLGR